LIEDWHRWPTRHSSGLQLQVVTKKALQLNKGHIDLLLALRRAVPWVAVQSPAGRKRQVGLTGLVTLLRSFLGRFGPSRALQYRALAITALLEPLKAKSGCKRRQGTDMGQKRSVCGAGGKEASVRRHYRCDQNHRAPAATKSLYVKV
jgi:hypothetical protein